MISNDSCLLLLTLILSIAPACDANAEAQMGGVADTGGPAGRSVETPIVEVRGETPYVEINGKEVAVAPDRIKFYPANGPFPSYGKIPPSWVFASGLTTHRVTQNFGEVGEGALFNKVFRFSVDLESPTLLDKVWIVVRLADANGNETVFVHNVGTLRPYKRTTVTIDKRLVRDLYDNPHVDWNLFAHGREVLNSMMRPAAFMESMSEMVARVRQGVNEAETEPYLTFPPRDASKAKHPFKLDLQIDRHGFIKSSSIVDGSDPKTNKSLLEAMQHWWFVPKRVNGRSVDCRVSVLVDLSKRKTWSKDCVALSSPSISSAPAAREQEISMSINPQEQSGSTRSELRTGIVPPVAVYQVLPVCPEALSRSGMEGKAIVEFHVEPDGSVQTVTVLAQTFEQLGPIAVQCVKRWKFRPALRDGVPVGIRMTVPIVFTSAGCIPVSSYDGYYDKDYLAKRYVTKARAREISALVAGLKYPLPLSVFHASVGMPGGQTGVLRQLTVDDETHVASIQLNALGTDAKYYALTIYYVASDRGSFADPRVKKAEVVLTAPMPIPDFQVDETPTGSR